MLKKFIIIPELYRNKYINIEGGHINDSPETLDFSLKDDYKKEVTCQFDYQMKLIHIQSK